MPAQPNTPIRTGQHWRSDASGQIRTITSTDTGRAEWLLTTINRRGTIGNTLLRDRYTLLDSTGAPDPHWLRTPTPYRRRISTIPIEAGQQWASIRTGTRRRITAYRPGEDKPVHCTTEDGIRTRCTADYLRSGFRLTGKRAH